LAPSSLNCTPATPEPTALSMAVADRVTVPDTVPLGAVTLTVGAVVSGLVCRAAFTCAKVVVDVVVALAKSTVAGADNCIVDVSARACRSP